MRLSPDALDGIRSTAQWQLALQFHFHSFLPRPETDIEDLMDTFQTNTVMYRAMYKALWSKIAELHHMGF